MIEIVKDLSYQKKDDDTTKQDNGNKEPATEASPKAATIKPTGARPKEPEVRQVIPGLPEETRVKALKQRKDKIRKKSPAKKTIPEETPAKCKEYFLSKIEKPVLNFSEKLSEFVFSDYSSDEADFEDSKEAHTDDENEKTKSFLTPLRLKSAWGKQILAESVRKTTSTPDLRSITSNKRPATLSPIHDIISKKKRETKERSKSASNSSSGIPIKKGQ